MPERAKSAPNGAGKGSFMAEGNTIHTDLPATAEPSAAEHAAPTGGTGAEPADDWQAKYEALLKQSRKNEDRAKANYAKAKAYDEAQKRADEADGKLAELAEKAEQAEAELAALRSERERSKAVAEVAKSSGLPVGVLELMRGDTREELEAAAGAVKAAVGSLPIYPTVPDGGAPGAAVVTREQIDAIKDPGERISARARNLKLYQ